MRLIFDINRGEYGAAEFIGFRLQLTSGGYPDP